MKELKHLNKYFKKYWFKLLVGMIITVIARVFSLVMPSYVKNSIEVVEDYMADEISKGEANDLLLGYILIIVGAALLSGLFTFLMRRPLLIFHAISNTILKMKSLITINF